MKKNPTHQPVNVIIIIMVMMMMMIIIIIINIYIPTLDHGTYEKNVTSSAQMAWTRMNHIRTTTCHHSETEYLQT